MSFKEKSIALLSEKVSHSVHWGINPPPQKYHPLFPAKPLLNRQTVQPPTPSPVLDNPLSTLVFRESHSPKGRIFQ